MKIRIAMLVFLIPVEALAGDGSKIYWVAPNGAQTTWSDCESANPLDGAVACSLAAANANAVAGDTVRLRGGAYVGQSIKPTHSGASETQRLVFTSQPGETATIQDSSDGIWIYKQSYITVEGLEFTNLKRFLRIYAGHYNTISHCRFDKRHPESGEWAGGALRRDYQDTSPASEPSTYNWIHHCSFSKFIYGAFDEHRGSLLDIGNNETAGDQSSFNRVEDCSFAYGGHHTLGVYAKFNIIRNSYFHNETWDYQGYRDAITEGPEAGRCLYEGNRYAYAYAASGLALRSHHNILRRNEFYNNGLGGIQIVAAGTVDVADNNRIYHNVFYHNGHEGDYAGFEGGLFFANWGNGDPKGNIVKNNIFFDNKNGAVSTDGISDESVLALGISSNWDQNGVDPGFVNLSAAGPSVSDLPDFHLVATSPAKDAATWLTTVTSPAGTGTVLQVEDADYFLDGWGVLTGDRIQLQGQTGTAVITKVDYDTDTITVDSPLTYTSGQGVALAFVDSAPDLGAHEIGESGGQGGSGGVGAGGAAGGQGGVGGTLAAGSGGAAQGGAGGTAKAGSAGTSAGAAGSATGGASGAPPSATPSEDSGGCGCRVGRVWSREASLLILAIVGATRLRRRSRTSRRQ